MRVMHLDYAWLGQGLAIDLVNTYVPAQGVDLLDHWPELDGWPPIDGGDLLRLRADATAVVDSLIEGTPLPDDLRRRVNAASVRNPDEVTLGPDGSQTVRTSLAGAVARDLIRLVADNIQLERCPAPGCGMVYPRSRSNQRWCSTSCGNRARVARHAQRRRHDSTAHSRSSG